MKSSSTSVTNTAQLVPFLIKFWFVVWTLMSVASHAMTMLSKFRAIILRCITLPK